MKEAVTKVIVTLTQEDFHGTLQKLLERKAVHCSRGRLLRRGPEFHVCTLNKMLIRKKSRNLFNNPRMCVCVCVCVERGVQGIPI